MKINKIKVKALLNLGIEVNIIAITFALSLGLAIGPLLPNLRGGKLTIADR